MSLIISTSIEDPILLDKLKNKVSKSERFVVVNAEALEDLHLDARFVANYTILENGIMEVSYGGGVAERMYPLPTMGQINLRKNVTARCRAVKIPSAGRANCPWRLAAKLSFSAV